MVTDPAVLVALPAEPAKQRRELEGWVRDLGYRPRFTDDASEAVDWLRADRDAFAASFLDSEMAAAEGAPVWRIVQPLVGRRLVLVLADRRRDLWFEALRAGVGALLPRPFEVATVRAAMESATGRPDGGGSQAGRTRSS